jgi:hypothetical protein
MSLDCLNKIVGLSQTPCTCWDSEKPVDFDELNQSTSGLYVSQPDTIPLRWTGGSADCENGGVWELIINARDNAVRDLTKDFLTAVQQVKSNQFIPFTKIGDDYFSRFQNVNGSSLGAFIEPYCIKGGLLRLQGVKIAFFSGIAVSTDVLISVYSSKDPNTLITSATATVTANKQFFEATFAEELVIDLGEIRTDINERLYFTYDLPAGAIPVENDKEIRACCGSSLYEKNPYLQILSTLGGVQANNQGDLISNPLQITSTLNGLVIVGTMECDYYSWLCTLAQKPSDSFSVSGGGRLNLGMALADGIQAKSLVNLANSLLMGRRINEFSMIQDPKNLYHIRGHYLKIYQHAIDNLVYYMPDDVTDCLVCNDDDRIKKSSIIV